MMMNGHTRSRSQRRGQSHTARSVPATPLARSGIEAQLTVRVPKAQPSRQGGQALIARPRPGPSRSPPEKGQQACAEQILEVPPIRPAATSRRTRSTIVILPSRNCGGPAPEANRQHSMTSAPWIAREGRRPATMSRAHNTDRLADHAKTQNPNPRIRYQRA